MKTSLALYNTYSIIKSTNTHIIYLTYILHIIYISVHTYLIGAGCCCGLIEPSPPVGSLVFQGRHNSTPSLLRPVESAGVGTDHSGCCMGGGGGSN